MNTEFAMAVARCAANLEPFATEDRIYFESPDLSASASITELEEGVAVVLEHDEYDDQEYLAADVVNAVALVEWHINGADDDLEFLGL